MKLEDYINNVKRPNKVRAPEFKFTALDLDHYSNISEEKKELIKSVFPYLSEDLFMDVIDRYDEEASEYAYYQTRSNDGFNVLVRIKICNSISGSDMFQAISRETLEREYNRCTKFGSQDYAIVKLLVHRHADDSIYDQYVNLYYVTDGKVFLDTTVANIISKMKESDLGRGLARVCIDCMENEQHGYSRIRE